MEELYQCSKCECVSLEDANNTTWQLNGVILCEQCKNPCKLCGKQNDTALDECIKCQEIPQSHPYRQRVGRVKSNYELLTGISPAQGKYNYERAFGAGSYDKRVAAYKEQSNYDIAAEVPAMIQKMGCVSADDDDDDDVPQERLYRLMWKDVLTGKRYMAVSGIGLPTFDGEAAITRYKGVEVTYIAIKELL